MMSFRKVTLFLTVVSGFSLLGSASKLRDIKTDDAVEVAITDPGFALISQKVSRDQLQDLVDQPIADFDQDVGGGIQAYFSGLRYSIDFKQLMITPEEGHLHARIDFNSIKVVADTVKFQKKVGVTLKTTCKDTTMVAGSRASLHLDLDLVPHVENGQFRIDVPSVNFEIPDEEYDIDGPRECSGDLGVGQVVRMAIHRALQKANDRIAQSARDRVGSFVPEIAQQIQKALTVRISLNLSLGGGVPPESIILTTAPHRANVQRGLARFSVSANVEKAPAITATSASQDLSLWSNPEEAVVAMLSLRPELINELIWRMTPRLPTAFPVETDQSPYDQIFNRQSLSAILPDLNQIEMDRDNLFASFGFIEPPHVEIHREVTGAIKLDLVIPKMVVLLDIEQKGVRRRYFDLELKSRMTVELEVIANQLMIKVVPPGSMDVSGHWADGYIPTVDIFEQDVAQLVFSSFVEILYGAGPLLRVQVPSIPIGDQTLRVGSPFTTQSFIGVSLVQ